MKKILTLGMSIALFSCNNGKTEDKTVENNVKNEINLI